MAEIALSFDRVSRSYPRNIFDNPSAILRELVFPYFLLKTPWTDNFFALHNINLSLHKGQKIGVIGTHRSGKTTLAGVASGLLQPTEGRVMAKGDRLLINRPTAGFKSTLTSLENLRLRAALSGLYGEILDDLLDKTLYRCGVSYAEASKPIGNLSPYTVKQLGLSLLLELPADTLVIDEITSAGIRDSRWATRELMQEKINSKTALIISSDFDFVKESAGTSLLLHCGRIYGPFMVNEAIEYYHRLPQDEALTDLPDEEYDPTVPPMISYKAPSHDLVDQLIYDEPDVGSGSREEEESNIYNEKSSFWTKKTLFPNRPTWKILSIKVDGGEFSRSLICLIRQPGDILSVSIEMFSLCDQNYSGGRFSIFSGNSGCELGEFYDRREVIFVPANTKVVLSFDLLIPDWTDLFYGLAFCPEFRDNIFPLYQRMKILIYGLGKKNTVISKQTLQIDKIFFESIGC